MTMPQVRAQARAGFLRPARGPRRAYRFSYQDLVLLRAARALTDARIPTRRIRRALRRLRQQLPPTRSVTEIRVFAENGRIVVRDGSSTWHPESGQMHLDLGSPSRHKRKSPAGSAEPQMGGARDANTLVKRGRRLYDDDEVANAITLYRRALGLKRNHPDAAYYLGIALEDLGKTNEAIDAYRRAVENDPFRAEAHYRLAKLYETTGKRSAAIRHLKSYRELTTKGRPMRRQ
jgi:tetratricopeptide (TPR) repeat protein